MTTINTVEDFIRAMDANPEILEAVRARVLTREMLDLPGALQQLSWTLHQFMDSTDRRLGAVEATQVETIKRLDALEAIQVETIKRLDALEAGQKELRETLKLFMQATDKRLEALEGETKSLRVDVGHLKGLMAQQLFARRAGFVPGEMGYDMEAALAPKEIMNILNSADTSGIDRGDLESFKRSDSILRATDSDGGDHYIYLEVSFTIYPRDIQRAVDHAGRLTDWTGIPSHPAVAGVRVNWRAEDAIKDGEVHYHQIPEYLFRADR